MRKFLMIPVAVALGAVSLCATACSGIALVDGKTYADSIPVSLPPLAGLADGDYRGSYTIAVPAGSVAMAREFKVVVTLDSDTGTTRISGIVVETPEDFPDATLIPTMIARVIDAQSLEVDSVSGATFSSKSFLKAVEYALAP